MRLRDASVKIKLTIKFMEKQNKAKNLFAINRREELRQWAIKVARGCNVQKGDGYGRCYPCGTCFIDGLKRIMKENNPIIDEHNEPVDRFNEIWRAILQIRDEGYTNRKIKS